jgi:16S rRNA (cytosine967-C5)-methyltransferase
VLAAGGRVPKKFAKARPASAGPTLAAAAAQAKLSPARRVAFEILTLVGHGKGHSDELLHGVRTRHLSEPDRNLATALVMGVLRWQIALDARIRPFFDRPGQALAEPVALALRLGAFQLLHMDRIPPHAALSESVELCRAAGQPHATGLVNAILRRIAAAPAPRNRIFESTAAMAERLGHPDWLVARWVAHYGREAALKICEAGQTEPAPGGLFPPGPESEAEAEAGPSIDDGSRLVAEIAAAAIPATPGRAPRLWDCCAAPGGKTLLLAQRTQTAQPPAQPSSAGILATDINSRRLAPMQARLRRYPCAADIQTAVADATKLPASAGLFDLILCDVPCSGTGTLARNPEIRLRLTPEDLPRQATRQRAILTAALARLAPGGRLVYSTCSLEPEENEQVIEQAIAAAQGGFREVPIAALTLPIPLGTMLRSNALRTLPGVDPCDGFYAAVLERTG